MSWLGDARHGRDGWPILTTLHHPITVDRQLALDHASNPWQKFTTRRWFGFLRMQVRVARRLPAIVTVSESSRTDIAAQMGVDPERMTVVPVGVDHTVFRPSPDVEPVPGRLMVTSSSDVPMKGLVPLLEAVAKLRTERDVELVVVGKPRPGGRVDRAIERLGLEGAVRCVSGISDAELAREYGQAEVAVVPSLYEGFSLPAVEAMACGAPGGRHHRRGPPRGGRPRRRDGAPGPAERPGRPGRGPSPACSTTRTCGPAWARPAGDRVLNRFTWKVTAEGTAECYSALMEGRPLPGAVRAGVPARRRDRRRRPTVLTVDYDRLGVRPGDCLLDLGCGFGRHAFEAARRGAAVVALDAGPDEVAGVRDTFGAMADAGELSAETARCGAVQGDALHLPFADGTFDRVIASEVLEHIPDDVAAMTELARVLRPGGTMAVTVPRCGPEFVNWALSDEYHDVPGGHVRIYRRSTLRQRLSSTGLVPVGSHHAHGLHSPYWWLALPGGSDQRRQPGRRHLPPAAGLGHREGPAPHPAAPTGCSAR